MIQLDFMISVRVIDNASSRCDASANGFGVKMTERQIHGALVFAIIGLAIPMFLVLLKVDAPYAR